MIERHKRFYRQVYDFLYGITANGTFAVQSLPPASTQGANATADVKPIGRGHLRWFSLVNDYPQTINRRGLLRITPVESYDGMPGTFTLQFAPNGAFTALSTSNYNW